MTIFSPTAAKRVADNPADFSVEDMHAALDMIVNSERFSESQVTKMQAAIEAELLKRTFPATTTYPIHTPISAIKKFDRSTKVIFECMLSGHETSRWMSKQPSCSRWFADSDSTIDCGCPMNGDTWWTSEEYTS